MYYQIPPKTLHILSRRPLSMLHDAVLTLGAPNKNPSRTPSRPVSSTEAPKTVPANPTRGSLVIRDVTEGALKGVEKLSTIGAGMWSKMTKK